MRPRASCGSERNGADAAVKVENLIPRLYVRSVKRFFIEHRRLRRIDLQKSLRSQGEGEIHQLGFNARAPRPDNQRVRRKAQYSAPRGGVDIDEERLKLAGGECRDELLFSGEQIGRQRSNHEYCHPLAAARRFTKKEAAKHPSAVGYCGFRSRRKCRFAKKRRKCSSRFFHPDGRLRTVFCRDKYLAACSVVAKTTDAVDDARIKHSFVAKMLSKRFGLPRRRLNQSFSPESGLAERLFNEQFDFESKLCGILPAPQRTAAADGLAVKRRSMRAAGRIRVGRRSAFSPFHGESPMAAGFGRVPEKIASRTGKCAGHENFRDIFALGVVAQSRDAGSRRVDAGNEHIGEYFRTLSGRPRRMTAAHQRAAQRRSAYMTTSAAMTMPTSTPERLKSAREASS